MVVSRERAGLDHGALAVCRHTGHTGQWPPRGRRGMDGWRRRGTEAAHIRRKSTRGATPLLFPSSRLEGPHACVVEMSMLRSATEHRLLLASALIRARAPVLDEKHMLGCRR
jgi:hypothetical protein